MEQDERERDKHDGQEQIQEATQLAGIPSSNTEKEPAEKCQETYQFLLAGVPEVFRVGGGGK